ncbi:MAG: hypothetical protein IID41_06835 [Planctomycetes bacterium]|nr:hypothetical protein [Planctomycetota bacterium]
MSEMCFIKNGEYHMRAVEVLCAKCYKNPCVCEGQFSEVRAEPYGVESWATRIEAAIKRAEEELGDADYVTVQRQQLGTDTVVVAITREEIALVEALWDVWRSEFEGPSGFNHIPDALIAFTEKVEEIA